MVVKETYTLKLLWSALISSKNWGKSYGVWVRITIKSWELQLAVQNSGYFW